MPISSHMDSSQGRKVKRARYHLILTAHKEDKYEKSMKIAKLDKAQKETKKGKNINKAYPAFLCALT